MRVAYVLGTFPKLSETFILREIQEMERQGVAVELFALARSDGPMDKDVASYADRTTYRAGAQCCACRIAECVRSVACLARDPGRGWRAIREGLPCPLQVMRCLRGVADGRAFAAGAAGKGIERVHAHFAGMPALVGLVMADVLRVPFSFSAHANDVFVGSEALAWKADAADLILTCNESARDELLGKLPPASRPKVQLVHHGLPLEEYPFLEERPAPDPPRIVSVGRLEEKKGYPDLLRSVKALADKGLEFSLEIIGDGAERNALERLCGELGIESRVHFLGAQPHSVVVERIRGAALFALASKQTAEGDRDGIPNVLLEAAALGTPILATRSGSIPEFVNDERVGILSPPGQPDEFAISLERALNDREMCDRLRVNARREVETNYDLRANVAAIRSQFESTSREE